MITSRTLLTRALVLALSLASIAGCQPASGAGSGSGSPAPLSADAINLVFVSTPDLAFQGPGDVNPDTANLTSQGLQRSLLMATYLKERVLGGKNVSRIFALAPMTHPQTAHAYPDMAAIGYIEQFAMLNQVSLTGLGGYGSIPYTANSYPMAVSYGAGPLPSGVATSPDPCASCQGLDFADSAGGNEAIVKFVLEVNVPGSFVFAAPWETISPLMASVGKAVGSSLALPASYPGPNTVHVISITRDQHASLAAYDAGLSPASTYPAMPGPVASAACPGAGTTPALFTITATNGVGGATVPAGMNANETLYMIRHAEAHPIPGWEGGNYVAAGQWRALAIATALRGRISPTQVWSIDPAQVADGDQIPGNANFSYVRPSLTIEPYAIANNVPFSLVSGISLAAKDSPQLTSDMFFKGGTFSNQTAILAWEHDHIPQIVSALLAGYFPSGSAPAVPSWPGGDYDTIWTVKLDGTGNLTVDNTLCEGVDSSKLPAEAPRY